MDMRLWSCHGILGEVNKVLRFRIQEMFIRYIYLSSLLTYNGTRMYIKTSSI